MPTLSELQAVQLQSYLIGGLDQVGNYLYWSSTAANGTDYYAIRMTDGAVDIDKDGLSDDEDPFNLKKKVRCVRAD